MDGSDSISAGISQKVRSWFCGLPAEERAAALSFIDGAFLSIIASLSSSSTQPAATNKRPASREGQGLTTDWSSLVHLQDIERLYIPQETMNTEDAAAEENVGAAAVVTDEDVVARTPAECDPSDKVQKREAVEVPGPCENLESNDIERAESDAYRIQRSAEGSLDDSSGRVEKKKNKSKEERVAAVTKAKNAAAQALLSQSNHTKVAALMDEVRLVFPSVFNSLSDQKMPEPTPFVVFRPAFLEKKTGKDILGHFEKASQGDMGSQSWFLSTEFCEAASTSTIPDALPSSFVYLERLKSLVAKGTLKKEKIPLYLLFLLRMEAAAYEYYHLQENAKISAAAASVGANRANGGAHTMATNLKDETINNTTKQKTGPDEAGKDSSIVDPAVAKKPTDGVVKPEDTLGRHAERRRLFHGLAALPKGLHSRLNAVKRTGLAIDKEPFKDSLAPFLTNSVTQVEDIMLGPLAWISSSTVDDSGSEKLDLSLIDEALQAPMNVIDEHLSVDSLVRPKTNRGSVGGSAADKGAMPHKETLENGNGRTAQTTTSTAGKKSRKKKRRKRKSSNADLSHQGKVAEPPASQKGADETSQKDSTDIKASEGAASEKAESQSRKKNDLAEKSIDAVNSFETENTDYNALHESLSMKSDATQHEESTGAVAKPSGASKGDITISRVDGVGTTCVVVAPRGDQVAKIGQEQQDSNEKVSQSTLGHAKEDDHSAWETVEVKGRSGKRKGSTSQTSGNRFASQHSHGSSSGQGSVNSSVSHHSSGSKKAKGARTSQTRRKNATRKIVRDIISSVLDSVDEKVRRNQRARSSSSSEKGSSSNGQPKQGKEPRTKQTPQDASVGRKASSSALAAGQKSARMVRGNSNGPKSNAEVSRSQDSVESGSPLKRSSANPPTAADQNTAPTVPETLYSFSATSRKYIPIAERDAARSDSSSGEDEAPKIRTSPFRSVKDNPPLPTMLSPSNANSASSSVASSLEAPHASRHHHTGSTLNENDVGYHLLDVCDRLTKDTGLFMKRRAVALNVRRNERGAVLNALRETLSTLWPSRCTVEMYGSCATELDLPSSDLDLVVCGLDRPSEVMMNVQPAPSQPTKPAHLGGERAGVAESSDVFTQESLLHQHHQQSPLPQYNVPYYAHMSVNGGRVLRLAAELEKQPWAVHVKAIPTASVPVVKILADPARLPGTVSSGGGDWMIQQHHMAAQATAAPGDSVASADPQSPGGHPSVVPCYHPPHAPPAWRGADLMNGLLKVDITFEGPEHGGIGSTEFSTRVVQDACAESGLSPEETPAIQMLMVLKELLAQRRLNEPFSGGLSSYALLLLALAVLNERAFIREELERVERQRRAVAAGGGNSSLVGIPSDRTEKETTIKTNAAPRHLNDMKAPTTARSGTADHDGTPGDARKSGNVLNGKMPTSKVRAENPPAKSALVGSRVLSRSSSMSPAPSKALSVEPHARSAPSSPVPGKGAAFSWASIARKNSGISQQKSTPDTSAHSSPDRAPSQSQRKSPAKRAGTFADAVARPPPAAPSQGVPSSERSGASTESAGKANGKTTKRKESGKVTEPRKKEQSFAAALSGGGDPVEVTNETASKGASRETTKPSKSGGSNVPVEHGLAATPSLFPQGFNDIIEVLCSGEDTAGKLLMHFLLFYGQHFDSHATAIDLSGKHPRDAVGGASPYTHMSPYIQRRSGGSIDPVTGMLTVDPIVVYDPLEGAENNNVARSCFCWSNIRWVFAQSYMTLSNAVERSATPPATPGGGVQATADVTNKMTGSSPGEAEYNDYWNGPYRQDDRGNHMDSRSPLLELLLSF